MRACSSAEGAGGSLGPSGGGGGGWAGPRDAVASRRLLSAAIVCGPRLVSPCSSSMVASSRRSVSLIVFRYLATSLSSSFICWEERTNWMSCWTVILVCAEASRQKARAVDKSRETILLNTIFARLRLHRPSVLRRWRRRLGFRRVARKDAERILFLLGRL